MAIRIDGRTGLPYATRPPVVPYDLARTFYNAWRDANLGVQAEGDPPPLFERLTPRQQSAWLLAATKTINRFRL